MGEALESVKIVHETGDEGVYRLLTDFFRFTGFFVYNCPTAEATEDRVQVKYTVKFQGNDAYLDDKVFYNTYFDCVKATDNDKKKYICNLIRQMTKETDEDKKALICCADIFIDYHMLKLMNTTNTFHKIEKVMKSTLEGLVGAYNAIYEKLNIISENESMQTKMSGKYAIYARTNTARFINEVCNILNKERMFDTEALLDYLASALDIDSSFYNVYALMGFVADTDRDFYQKAVVFYQKLIDFSGDLPYLSYIYYRQGRVYEKIMKDSNKALAYYQKAYDVNNRNYRALYKMAVSKRNEEQYEETRKIYEQILYFLKERYEKNQLHAIGYEYIYKALINLGDMYQKTLPQEAIKYYRRLKEMFDDMDIQISNDIVRNSFYQSVYGQDAYEYFKYTRKRYPNHNLFLGMYQANVLLGNEDEAKFYWQKLSGENNTEN